MSKIISLIAILLTIVSLSSEWQQLGLSDHIVNDMRLFDNYLFVGTDNGIYRKDVNQPDTLWVQLGLPELFITSLTVIDENNIIAGLSSLTSDNPIMRTDNGGVVWYPFSEGIDYDALFEIMSLDVHPELTPRIFATGISSVLRFNDPLSTWELVWGDWDNMAMGYHFVRIHPEDPDLIWVGGEYGSLSPFLAKSYDSGSNWIDFNLWLVVGGDNACQSIAFDPFDDQTLYVGMEGRVIKSIDGGYEWEVMMESSCDIWGVRVSNHNNQIIYATSMQRSIFEDLLLYFSNDGGLTWNTVNGGFGRRMTLCMEYRALNGNDELYLGTSGDGVFKYTNVIDDVSADDNSTEIIPITKIHNYPNPFNSRTTISFTLPEMSEINLSVYSSIGVRIITLQEGVLQKGEHSILWDGADKKGNLLPSGIYFSVLEIDGKKIVDKMLLLK